MNENQSVLRELNNQTLAGTASFPQIVGQLVSMGYESYHVDLIRKECRYYKADNESTIVELSSDTHQIAAEFSATRLQDAIRASQSGAAKYPEFLKEACAAGCSYYIVFMSGKKVIYFGRNGDGHTEHFPNSK